MSQETQFRTETAHEIQKANEDAAVSVAMHERKSSFVDDETFLTTKAEVKFERDRYEKWCREIMMERLAHHHMMFLRHNETAIESIETQGLVIVLADYGLDKCFYETSKSLELIQFCILNKITRVEIKAEITRQENRKWEKAREDQELLNRLMGKYKMNPRHLIKEIKNV